MSNSDISLIDESRTTKSAWWVNQGQAYDVQRDDGYLWAPKFDRRGVAPIHWRTLADVKKGDVIVHHTHGAIVALSLVLEDAIDAERPPGLAEASDTPWQSDGRRINVQYVDVKPKIPTDKFMKRIAALNIENGPVDAAFRAKQGYLFRLNSEALSIIRDCSEMEWPDWARSTPAKPNRWLFQANPKFWNLVKELGERTEGDSESWVVTRMGDEMRPGDPVVFWQSGEKAGIYALGVLISSVHERPTPAWQVEAGITAETGQAVDFRYTRILRRPVPRTELERHSVLRGLSVIQAPQGTNFRVTSEQWQALQLLLEDPANSARWDEFVRWARRYYEEDDYNETERDYKLDYASKVAQARQEFFDREEQWFTTLKQSLNGKAHPVSWRVSGEFRKWCEEHPDQAQRALAVIWQENLEPIERVRAFLDLVPHSGVKSPSGRISLAAYLQSSLDPTTLPIYRVTVFEKAFKLVDYPSWPERADEAGHFEYAIGFLDNFIAEAAKRDLQIQDRLDAQGLTWLITQWPGYDHWSDEERESFLQFQSGESPDIGEGLESSELVLPTTSELAGQLLIGQSHIEEIQYLLSDKRQLIFYGPPGTGKTYLAKELAKFFAMNPEDREEDGMVKIVQFHPSYAYEDFVQGFRPQASGEGAAQFALVDGPLLEIARIAESQPDVKQVLIIDEINRGNVAKVLGELYFLLEYRDEAIQLQYSSDDFKLPENLWIIGTMNTADRSIALIDAALRRRFYFVPFFPDRPPIEGLLRRYLTRNRPEMIWVADVVDRANTELGDRHGAIGPSYFMKDNLDEKWVKRIWEHAVIPYLAEQFFGEEERLDAFTLDRLRGIENEPEVIDGDAPDQSE